MIKGEEFLVKSAKAPTTDAVSGINFECVYCTCSLLGFCYHVALVDICADGGGGGVLAGDPVAGGHCILMHPPSVFDALLERVSRAND